MYNWLMGATEVWQSNTVTWNENRRTWSYFSQTKCCVDHNWRLKGWAVLYISCLSFLFLSVLNWVFFFCFLCVVYRQLILDIWSDNVRLVYCTKPQQVTHCSNIDFQSNKFYIFSKKKIYIYYCQVCGWGHLFYFAFAHNHNGFEMNQSKWDFQV